MSTQTGAAAPPSLTGTLARIRHTRLIAIVAAVGVPALAGALTATLIPRGPFDALQGLVIVGSSILVGLLAGITLPSRWTFVLAPMAYWLALELARSDAVGASIDSIRLDAFFGILALVVGRGFHALLVVPALWLGVGIGRLLASAGHPDGSEPVHRPPRQWPVVLDAVVVGLLVVGLLLPASTPPVLGPDGQRVPGSIAELATVRLGGVDQSIMIRAADPDRPVLLYLAGGPGQSDLALARAQGEPWTRDVVFVDWDQRGTGRSYGALAPTARVTLEQAVADTIELAELLRERFDESKIYLMGESWGTLLGVLAVQQRPDLFHAWISSGQMVDVVETDGRIYDELVALAGRSGDTDLAARLAAMGPPPYRDLPWSNAEVLTRYGLIEPPYTPSAGYVARGEAAGLDPFGALGTEYDLVQKTAVLRGLIDMFAIMYPQLYDLDLRRDAARLEVPVYQLDGTGELAGRRDLALEWFESLEAPSKELVTFEGAGHAVAFEQADAVADLLAETIIPATYVP